MFGAKSNQPEGPYPIQGRIDLDPLVREIYRATALGGLLARGKPDEKIEDVIQQALKIADKMMDMRP